MRLFLKIEAFESLVGKEAVAEARGSFGAAIGRIMGSGKVEFSGIFADARGGIFVLNVDTAEDVVELLGGEILDVAKVETHPLTTTEWLKQYFENNPPA